MSMYVYAKFRRTVLRIKKALGIFRELITTTRRTKTQGCKRDLGVRDRDETETFKFWVRDETETETLRGRDRDVFRDVRTLGYLK